MYEEVSEKHKSPVVNALIQMQKGVSRLIDSHEHDIHEPQFSLFFKEILEKELNLELPLEDEVFYWATVYKDYITLQEAYDLFDEMIVKSCAATILQKLELLRNEM
ncbi:MAG: hypothetical protein VX185_15550 [Pseudomonadota bacterium]|nr:hypothetical protein [Pseudomonadota bacterium]